MPFFIWYKQSLNRAYTLFIKIKETIIWLNS
nr:MAG TPA: hypothetical protein [Caudoviricetes sp.]DAP33783.1 MAG TPA: hypothetical protein [Caudoviricetes sp.]